MNTLRMGRGMRALSIVGLTATLGSADVGYAAPEQSAAVSAAAEQRQALLDQYCVTCHNERLQTGGLTLDTLDVAHVGDDAEVWEKVVRKLSAGAMPPAPRPRPDAATYAAFTTWLETELDQAAAAAPNPGRTEAFHRLNRAEYHNVVRDLLGLDVDVNELLPADDGSYGFDNIAGVLGMSPTLLERYLSAAKKVSRLAVNSPTLAATADTFRLAADYSQDDRVESLPFGTRGGLVIPYTFPLDADYVIRVRLGRDTSDRLAAFRDEHRLDVSLDGQHLETFTVGGPPPDGADRGSEEYREWSTRQSRADEDWEIRVPVRAGPRELRVTFHKKTGAYPDTLRQPYLRPYTNTTGGDTRYQPYVDSVIVTGPYEASGAPPVEETPSRARIFTCQRPTDGELATVAADDRELECARDILSSLARRAYRRPVTERDLNVLLGFYERGRDAGGFEAGIELALRRLLASPEFLFRVVRDPADASAGDNYRITDLELASRLSFFLWSSSPDDELLETAISGQLGEPAILEHQVRRLLADDRSSAMVENFAGQWLYLRNIPALVPDENRFPDFGEALRLSMRRETELFFESVMRDDRSVLDLLTANYTFVNERLARHYDIPNVYGSHFRRVTLGEKDDARRGLLGHGSILAATAYPTRTSPVLRGKWVLENLLGTPPPLPPPNVPSLEEVHDGRALSMREAMEQHRANPVCASCHRLMDPPGFALEQFDAVGRFRTRSEANEPIDASGVLPDGTAFEGAAGLREALMQRPDLFVTTVTEKLLTYALGRGTEHYDAPAIRAITREAAKDNHRFSALILGVVKSAPFQMRRMPS
jgi:mono/diheme cytochrome c family protein